MEFTPEDVGSASSLALVDIAIIVGFLIVVMLVGCMMSRVASKGLNEYFLGGRRIPWWILGVSNATSNFDMAGTMVIVAVVFSLGFKGYLVELRGGTGMALAFLVVFLAKWLRRSRVMTSAEWMKLRFGTETQGKWAHILSAIANIALSLGMIVYFSEGAGKFLTHFLPLSEVSCTSIMVSIGLFYTLIAGFYGVVSTDVVQMVLLIFTAVFVSVHAFVMRPDVELPAGFLDFDLARPAGLGHALLAKDPGQWEPVLGMFGLCVVMWFCRTAMEGMGGVGGYTDQRFFAARTERESSLVAMQAIILSIFRWTLVAGLVVMGYAVLQAGGPAADVINSDAENVLPVVLSQYLPAGVRGLVVAGLIAAAMSTFDSTLNAGAAYLVRDIYQGYVNPQASPERLVAMSRWATVGLCVAGVALTVVVPNISAIWGLITMGIGAGMFVPLVLRWYWPRFNGYGFAVGTGAGMTAALVFQAGLGWPLYYSFPTVIGIAVVGSIVTAVSTAPVPEPVLMRFKLQINPWGFWRRYEKRALELGKLSEAQRIGRAVENRNGVISLLLSLPFQFSILLAAMSFIFHAWERFSMFAIISSVCGIGLYFVWYRNLKSDEQSAIEDAEYDAAQP